MDILTCFAMKLFKSLFVNQAYMGQNFERCTIGSRHGVKLKFQKC